jgi:hypothetical protein
MPVKWYTAQAGLWQECAGSDKVAAAQPGDCVVRGDRETVIVCLTPAEGMYSCDFGAFSSNIYKRPY